MNTCSHAYQVAIWDFNKDTEEKAKLQHPGTFPFFLV